ncbi:MAG: hypothetical protein E6G03_14570 [Actinobacteria bacterium]|nr:MAG: hypothetical protein E6G03_14570 [Actinomycetota bacterium]
MSRVWLRAAALALVVIGVVVGLTVYFSSESTPPCLVPGAATWRPPSDGGTHRYEVVFPERAACFFAIDEQQRLVGALRLGPAKGISTAAPLQNDVALRTQRGVYTLDLRTGRLRFGGLAPFPSDTLTATDDSHRVLYVTQRGLLGFRVLDSHSGRQLYVVHYRGFTWNRRFGPDPPSHGLSLAPDRPELWVLDSPNSVVHLFDVSGLPNDPPRQIADIRLSKPISGDENPCSRACGRIGALLHSADGRFVYVGDSGDVIDTRTRETVANLEALHNSRVQLEVDWVNGKAVFPRRS